MKRATDLKQHCVLNQKDKYTIGVVTVGFSPHLPPKVDLQIILVLLLCSAEILGVV